jgi:dolichyl-phosphate beta-glucosyltransferase
MLRKTFCSKRTDLKDLTILIPCFNEEHRISATLKTLEAWVASGNGKTVEFIFVNDGSSDQTLMMLKQSTLFASVIHIETNQGKGGAIASGIEVVKSKWVLVMDADLSTSLECIETFYKAAELQNYDVLVGDRFHPLSNVRRSFTRSLSSYLFFFIIHALGKFEVFDTQCGFKMFRTSVAKELFKDLQLKRYSFDLEILSKAQGPFRILSLPISWEEKTGSGVRVLRDGFQILSDYRNYLKR